jgi:hypothetical protein
MRLLLLAAGFAPPGEGPVTILHPTFGPGIVLPGTGGFIFVRLASLSFMPSSNGGGFRPPLKMD